MAVEIDALANDQPIGWTGGEILTRLAAGSVGLNASLTIAKAESAGVILKDTNGVGDWTIAASDFFDQGGTGVHNHTLGIHFNADLAVTSLPSWGENWEPRWVPAEPPNGYFEKNWDYTSIDRAVSYRPFAFSVNLNDNDATMHWLLKSWKVVSRTGSVPTLQVRTDTTGVQVSGVLTVQPSTDEGDGAYRLHVKGAPVGTVLIGATATGMVADDVLYYGTMGSVTGSADAINISGSLTGILGTLFTNSGTGGTRYMMWAGSSGDAWVRTLANVDWSFGVDRSDAGRWKLSNADTLGTNDRIIVNSTGEVGIGAAPNANAILDLTSTTRAFMPPRMTTTERDTIASPTAGMIVYNTTTGKLNLYTTTWEAVTSA